MKAWLAQLARWVLAWAEPATPSPSTEAAVRQAYAHVGLNLDAFQPDLDLLPTGKLPELLYHSLQLLAHDHALTTVGAVMAALDGARRAH